MSWADFVASSQVHSRIEDAVSGRVVPADEELLALVARLDLLHADLDSLCMQELANDPLRGMAARYPDTSFDGEVLLLTPATALAMLCLSRSLKADLSPWLNDANLLSQLLILAPKDWLFFGLDRQDIPPPALAQLKRDGLFLVDEENWPFLFDQNASQAQASGSIPLGAFQVDCAWTTGWKLQVGPAELDQWIPGEARDYAAVQGAFLRLATKGALPSDSIAWLVRHGLDLSRLPISLESVDHIEMFWWQSKPNGLPDEISAIACMLVNALLVLIAQGAAEPSQLGSIPHPCAQAALSMMVSANANLVATLDQEQRNLLIRDQLDI